MDKSAKASRTSHHNLTRASGRAEYTAAATRKKPMMMANTARSVDRASDVVLIIDRWRAQGLTNLRTRGTNQNGR